MDLPTEGVITKMSDYTSKPKIKVVRDSDKQFTKAHSTDAGYDILASNSGSIQPWQSNLLSTRLHVAIPEGYVGIIKSRSGLSVKHGIDVWAGVIDVGYTGEVKVLLRNTKDTWFDYKSGDKIAQMVIVPICDFETETVYSLEDSARGNGGFNSTGYRHE